MGRTISEALRLSVSERAGYRCEYCLIPEVGRFIRFHIEHIRSIKHGGKTVEDNLALSCSACNFHKGSDIGTFLHDDQLIRFFNPRKDTWSEHFDIVDGVIISKTDIASATEAIFQFNTPERIIYRRELLLSDS